MDKKNSECIENNHSGHKEKELGPGAAPVPSPERLAGKTIIRFMHVSPETIGGLQKYVTDLDEELLKRNNGLTLIYLYPAGDSSDITVRKAPRGKGSIVSLPLNFELNADILQESTRSRIYRALRFIINALHLKEIAFTLVFNERFFRLFMTWPVFRELYMRSMNRMRWIPEELLIRTAQSIVDKYGKIDASLLHSMDIPIDNETFMNIMHIYNIPVLLMNHGTNHHFDEVPFQSMHAELYSVAMKNLLSRCEGVAGVTSVGVPASIRGKYCTLYDSIDMEYFHLSKADTDNVAEIKKKAGSDYLIILPARIHREKGQIDAVKLARHFRRVRVNVKIICVGPLADIDYKAEIDALIRKYELSGYLDFPGGVTREKMRDYYAAGDVVILLSRSEGLPRTILEAMSMEKPVVAYGIDGVPEEIEDGKTGYIIPIKRRADFRMAPRLCSLKILDLINDRSLGRRMGLLGRSRAEKRFGVDDLVSRHEQYYLSFMA